MAKRITKAQANFLGLLLLFGIIAAGIGKLFEVLGFAIPLIVVAVVVGGFFLYRLSERRKRLTYLRSKYGDEAIVQLILQHRFWQGQTSAQLIDSLGSPVSVDDMMSRTRARQIWKYDRRGTNRYGLRITLDDSVVVGWDQKAR